MVKKLFKLVGHWKRLHFPPLLQVWDFVRRDVLLDIREGWGFHVQHGSIPVSQGGCSKSQEACKPTSIIRLYIENGGLTNANLQSQGAKSLWKPVLEATWPQHACSMTRTSVIPHRRRVQMIWLFIGCGPLTVTVTTRIIPFLVGNPYKPSFPTVTVRGPHPNYSLILASAKRFHRNRRQEPNDILMFCFLLQ